MQLRSIRHGNYDQFADIFSFQNLQYPTLLLRISIPKISIGPMTHSGRNGWRMMCRVDTIRDCLNSAILIGRNCAWSQQLSIHDYTHKFCKSSFFFQLSHRLPREEEIGRKKWAGYWVGLNGPRGGGGPDPPVLPHINISSIWLIFIRE